MLNDKMELTKKDKIKLQLSSRQIKLKNDMKASKADDEHNDTWTSSSTYEVDAQERQVSLSPSIIDLSIDLSTVTTSDRDSDGTSEEETDKDHLSKFPLPGQKCYSPSTSSGRPMQYAWRMASHDGKTPSVMISARSSDTGYPCSPGTKCNCGRDFSDDSFAASIRKNKNAFNREEAILSLNNSWKGSKSTDLIYLYVNMVHDRNKLTKYLRPCHACSKPCCTCSDTLLESNRSYSVYPIFPQNISVPERQEIYAETSYDLKELSTKFSNKSHLKKRNNLTDKIIQTDPEMTGFGENYLSGRNDGIVQLPLNKLTDARENMLDEKERLDTYSFLFRRYINKMENGEEDILETHVNEPDTILDSGTSTLQFDDMNETDSYSERRRQKGDKDLTNSNKTIPLSMMQLATAAKCARLLADSLESVLEIAGIENEDYDQNKHVVHFARQHFSKFLETLTSLKSHFCQEQQLPSVNPEITEDQSEK